MTLRAMGPFNGFLPVPTGMAVGFVRDPSRFQLNQYAQYVPAPKPIFRYFSMDPDMPVRVVNTDENAWAPGDYRPQGKDALVRGEWLAGRVQRWDFPYTIDEWSEELWAAEGIDPQNLHNIVNLSLANTHRTVRTLAAMAAASWGSNASTVQALLGLATPIYWNQSTGQAIDPTTGLPDPKFQIIKRTLNRIRRRIDLMTNGAVGANEVNVVIPPLVANAVSEAGEIVEFLKGSPYAKELIDWRNRKWNLPDSYAGFNWVVEDAPKVTVRAKADGTVASITASERLYAMPGDTCYVTSRVGGLDGGYGMPNFSTLQLYTYKGEVRVEGFSEPKHELFEGHVVMADMPLVASTLSGFQLTSVLDPAFA